jgi:hypothetical protein
MRLALIFDTHLTPRAPAFSDNWQAAREWIEAADVDLLVSLGDISADGAGDPRELESARRAFEPLGVPARFLPGNHDIGDNPVEAGAPSEHPLDPDRLADYRRTVPKTSNAFRDRRRQREAKEVERDRTCYILRAKSAPVTPR